MRRFLYDTTIFIYALGALHEYREPCRKIVRRAALGELSGEASVDLVQELVHYRFRRTGARDDAVRNGKQAAALCRLHEFAPTDLPLALDLFRSNVRLTARDAFFAALALGRGINAILTVDRDFDDIPGLERIDPADTTAVDALASATG